MADNNSNNARQGVIINPNTSKGSTVLVRPDTPPPPPVDPAPQAPSKPSSSNSKNAK